MSGAIAIVGLACRYPGADSPEELWHNVLAQRRAFRPLPPERLSRQDYYHPSPDAADRTYAFTAALLDGYAFDRERHRVSGPTWRSADPVHWLALDVAGEALSDAGFDGGRGLDRARVGVVVGNTLTGEGARSQLLRLRWPYMRRVVDAELCADGWSEHDRASLLRRLEQRYKAPFAPVGDETLAGNLSNTIAGRICNHYDLGGGGYTVDGACASSLLSVITACRALEARDLDAALVGGVDVSLDPFELVGFAKAGALAAGRMRVFDAASEGFWPGEGCGFACLVRADEVPPGARVYAVLRGWGVSSDGSGGITRPEVEGQVRALDRAYDRAGFGADSVGYFEGHGTGTAVGDTTEIEALSAARRREGRTTSPAALGTIKANIGHTKAAAGIAGLIKAALAVHHQVIPPTTGCDTPHSLLGSDDAVLTAPRRGRVWPTRAPVRAGVSAMGFGGINSHVVLEGRPAEREALDAGELRLLRSPQDAEVLFFAGPDRVSVRERISRVVDCTPWLSLAEMADLAAWSAGEVVHGAEVCAAVVARDPAELAHRLSLLDQWLDEGATRRIDERQGVFLGVGPRSPRIAFLFPGQGSRVRRDGGAWSRRFPAAESLFDTLGGEVADPASTEVAQPAVVAAALAGRAVLECLGLLHDVALGHSLGELVALRCAGAMDDATLAALVAARSNAMVAHVPSGGAMASLRADPAEATAVINGYPVHLANLNGPLQTVVAGSESSIEAVARAARQRGVRCTRLSVSHAFHSPLMTGAVAPFARSIEDLPIAPVSGGVISTVYGRALCQDDDPRALLVRQVTDPVRFTEALAALGEVDLLVEVGPDRVLTDLVKPLGLGPAIALDVGGPSLAGLLCAVAAAFALGAPIRPTELFADRFVRPFDPARRPTFFANPCEAVEQDDARREPDAHPPDERSPGEVETPSSRGGKRSTQELVHALVAERLELPLASVDRSDRLLGDLHLSSLAIGQIAAEAARQLGLAPLASPTDFAHATVAELAGVLEDLRVAGPGAHRGGAAFPAGVDRWVRAFHVEHDEAPLPRRGPPSDEGGWEVCGPSDHPLLDSLRRTFAVAPGTGLVVVVEDGRQVTDLARLVRAGRRLAEVRPPFRFVLVEDRDGAAAFARTVHAEHPDVDTCVVRVQSDDPLAADRVRDEALTVVGFSEMHYDLHGRRSVPVLAPLQLTSSPGSVPLDAGDVLLVTGGGKGIGAECARALSLASGCRLVLMGRSDPHADSVLRENLRRLSASGARVLYARADVTDAAQVRSAVELASRELAAPITAVLHAAGRNQPRRIAELDVSHIQRTSAPKADGLSHVLAAVEPSSLKLVVAFGSIIGRVGMHGEADYALANEWLRHDLERWGRSHRRCTCLVLEWSVWSGVGMGERLGGVDALEARGISAIRPDEGVDALCRLVAAASENTLPGAVVVSGRLGRPGTLRWREASLPALRFLELCRVHVPRTELVVDARISAQTDPYLRDHELDGAMLFPAVLGLEAFAQVAMALTGASRPPRFTNVQFDRPVVVPDRGSVSIRIAALCRAPGVVDLVLRSEETSLQVDHFCATCRFDTFEEPGQTDLNMGESAVLDASDLYGSLFFQRGRFRRVERYFDLGPRRCVAEIDTELRPSTPWFGTHHAHRLVLGDPGARDAVLHAIGVCVPDGVLIPTGVDRLEVFATSDGGGVRVEAVERARVDDDFVYDVRVYSAVNGELVERWTGLRLRRVDRASSGADLPPLLLAVHIERRLMELGVGDDLEVAVVRDGGASPHDRRTQAVTSLLGRSDSVFRRADGRPVTASGTAISIAHDGDVTVVATGAGTVGCDAETVAARQPSQWSDLLGPERAALAGVVARDAGESLDVSATRVWCALECLKKAGLGADGPLVLSQSGRGWVSLGTGRGRVHTLSTSIRGDQEPVVFGFFHRGSNALL